MNLPSRLGEVQQENDAMQMLFSYDTNMWISSQMQNISYIG